MKTVVTTLGIPILIEKSGKILNSRTMNDDGTIRYVGSIADCSYLNF